MKPLTTPRTPTKEELIDFYVTKKLTPGHIKVHFGVSLEESYKLLAANGIELRKKGKNKSDSSTSTSLKVGSGSNSNLRERMKEEVPEFFKEKGIELGDTCRLKTTTNGVKADSLLEILAFVKGNKLKVVERYTRTNIIFATIDELTEIGEKS
jgi:hypothetical protein